MICYDEVVQNPRTKSTVVIVLARVFWEACSGSGYDGTADGRGRFASCHFFSGFSDAIMSPVLMAQNTTVQPALITALGGGQQAFQAVGALIGRGNEFVAQCRIELTRLIDQNVVVHFRLRKTDSAYQCI